MVVNQNSIAAIRSPEVIAKSLMTRQRNKKIKEELKRERIASQMEQETKKLAQQMATSAQEETLLSKRTSNLESHYLTFNEKLTEMKFSIKEFIQSNTKPQEDPRLQQAIDEVASLKSTLTNSLTTLEAEILKLEAQIIDKSKLVNLDKKINNLFELFYNTQPNPIRQQLQEYSQNYNFTPPREQPQQQQRTMRDNNAMSQLLSARY